MAVDTKAKRFSMLNFGVAFKHRLLPPPDAVIDLPDRVQRLGLYNGIDITFIQVGSLKGQVAIGPLISAEMIVKGKQGAQASIGPAVTAELGVNNEF